MLVLSRQRDETVMIDFSTATDEELLALRGTPIEVTVVDIRGDKVRLGTTAPKPVQVHRREIFDAIRRDGAKARYAADRHAAMVARG
jgi:carbon storage regulator